ncbi:MAG: DNA polymerase III subunit gamma/tau [Bacteroidetes bacterium]|nr:DNA polymerase III subunit gamma/tau [Bacteroidota bacterium]MDA0943329.1 DNA polymerase III subunit gamma/tau [Bacteroidota bacterium]
MSAFVVSARKYRPLAFDQVVGQRHVADTLMHEINSGKLAQAFLFTGPRGVGKTTCARILAKVINQKEANDGKESDYAFNIFELDAASNNSVDDIRHLIDQVRIPPQVGKYKVYIIDEVHMLSAQAFNAFLKTLEEPPSYAIFILATTEKHKILPTILSRCQVFNFNRISTDDMVQHLKGIAEKEGIEADDDALHLIAVKADGGLRDALSMFDQLVSFGEGKLAYNQAVDILSVLDPDYFFQLSQTLFETKASEALVQFDSILNKGFDGSVFVSSWAQHLRNLILCQDAKTASLLDVGESFRDRYLEQSQKLGFAYLLNGLNMVSDCDEKYKNSRNPRLLIELCLLKMAQLPLVMGALPSFEELKKKGLSLNHAKPISDRAYKPEALIRVEPDKATSTVAVTNPVPTSETESVSKDSPTSTIIKAKLPLSKGFEAFKAMKKEAPTMEVASHEVLSDAVKTDPTPNIALTLDQIKSVWSTWCSKQTPRINGSLSQADLSWQDNEILAAFSAVHVKEILEEVRSDLIPFLQRELGMRGLSVSFVLKESESEGRRPYTDKEKLDYLMEKHPKLKEVVDLLNLRIP